MAAAVVVAIAVSAVSPAPAQAPGPNVVSALSAPPGAMAEATIAADPSRPGHLAAAADPYLDPVRIVVVLSVDGGATWSSPTTVLPQGYAKSYDPALAFDADGSIVVAGGTSETGAPHCQPASAIFMATIRGNRVDYNVVRDTRADDAYVDRPGLVMKTSGAVRTFVTWTESTGPAAECRAVPVASTIMLARLDDARAVVDIRALPGGGLGAPFGATMTLGTEGTLHVAIADHDAGGNGRLVLLRSADEGATLSAPIVVDEGPDVPLVVDGVGGVVAPVPSIASHGGRVAVAWNRQGPAGPDVGAFESVDGGEWHPLGSPSAEAPALLPALTYDRGGRIWLLVGRVGDGAIDYELHDRDVGWRPGLGLGHTPSLGFSELGEGLGLASAGDQVVTAVPIDGAAASSLSVARVPTPTRPVPAPDPSSSPLPSSTDPPASRRSPTRSRGLAAVVVVATVLGLTGAVIFARARRRR